MSILVKGMSGQDVEVASKGVSNAALGLGIAGTALGVLNSGFLGGNGLLGGGVGTNAVANGSEALINAKNLAACCFVDKDTFYLNLLNQANTNAERDISTERRFSALESAIAVNSTANNYQNTIINNNMEFNRVLGDKNLALATCDMVRGTPMISPTQIGDNYVAPTRVLDSYTPREYLPGRGFYGGQAGYAYGGYGLDCGPCDGFRGF